jgi:uncharacterized protein YjbI with pentapeptide repeats
MADDTNLAERIVALERALAARRGAGWRLFPAAALLLFAALVAWNFWLSRELLAARRQTTLERHFWVVGHGAFPAKERADSFVALVLAGNRDWRGARLDGLKLPGVSMPNAELSGGDFTGSDLSKSTFTGAKLVKAKFPNGDLSGADLLQTRLPRAQLRRTKFTGANLEQVDLTDAAILAADFTDAILYMANLTRANLSGSDFTGVNFEAAILRGANLSLARLSNVSLKDADFTDANWWRARGLTSQQLVQLAKKYSPSDSAPAALRDDYLAWLRKNEPGR